MSTLADRIKNAIQKADLTYEEIEHKTGISKSALQRYATGKTKKIPLDRIEEIAKATNVPAAYLMGWEDEPDTFDIFAFDDVMPITTQKLPLLGNIACGEPIFADEQFEVYVSAGAEIKADFCLRAKGDSMIGARINDGDIVFIRKQEMVENGEIAAVLIEDETTLKRVYFDREAEVLSLCPENPKYKIKRYSGEELNQIRIIGKAVAFQSDVE